MARNEQTCRTEYASFRKKTRGANTTYQCGSKGKKNQRQEEIQTRGSRGRGASRQLSRDYNEGQTHRQRGPSRTHNSAEDRIDAWGRFGRWGNEFEDLEEGRSHRGERGGDHAQHVKEGRLGAAERWGHEYDKDIDDEEDREYNRYRRGSQIWAGNGDEDEGEDEEFEDEDSEDEDEEEENRYGQTRRRQKIGRISQTARSRRGIR